MTPAERDVCIRARESVGDVGRDGVDFGTNTGALISRDNFVDTLDVSG
jgi:hypothetical protein